MDFYARTIERLLVSKLITQTDSVLVLCGEALDAKAWNTAGFGDVTISNLDDQYAGPHKWEYQDAEHITRPDSSVDWAVVHAGIHHCRAPHRAILEMLRVARKGILVMEARDSFMMRVATRLRLTETHEIASVVNDIGGLRNGPIPNYIYRWTEREVEKLMESAYPERINDVRFFYGMRFPARGVAAPLWLVARLMQWLAPRQCNLFGFAILHTRELKPWITADGKGVRSDWHR